ncbi:MAG: energy-coupled thiamine transporter ThiT [Oscillospiraceae bacterium]|nr:energy-coupled thiamine transporter ThiT [Oscillospiraceae bacterium]
MKGNSTTNKITEGAVIVALTVVLNFFKLDLGPEGGSVNLVFIPLMVFALRRGTFWGIGAGLVFGVLKAIIGGGISYGWQSLLLDYAVAYALVGLAGLLPSRPVLSTVFGAAGCLASFVLSGVLIWGQYMPESFYGLTMKNVWVYSLLYNGSFVLCNEIIAAVVIAFFAGKTKLLKV